MVRDARILIAGGYGVFGRLLARELLATTGAQLVLAGRDLDRARRACRELGGGSRVEPLRLDLDDLGALGRAAERCVAVAGTAGPFQALAPGLVRATVGAGAHWVDIADDPAWIGRVLADRDLGIGVSRAGLAVVPGQSSVPALAGALVGWCAERLPSATHARVTLFIGNRNAKGAGAIASALGASVRDPVQVDLPVGRVSAYRFAYPDATLLAGRPGLVVAFRVAFEWCVAGLVMTSLAPVGHRLGPVARARLARVLSLLTAPLSRFGSSRGCLQADLWSGRGERVSTALISEGQRLAVLPCALALEALLDGSFPQRGLVQPSGWLAPDEWLARLRARNVVVQHATGP